MNICEGGNVFKDKDGSSLTQRINQTDVKTTIAWLDQMLPGLDLQDKTLGSTGLKPTSGDLDLYVDENQVSKEQLTERLFQWATSHKFKPEEYIKKSGISVHFKTPINGRPDLGYVQTDFMFTKKPDWSIFIMRSDANSQYKGADRNIMLSSLAKTLGYKINQTVGLVDRNTNTVLTDEPDKIAKLLLNKQATKKDLDSVENVLAALAKDPKRDLKLADFREYLAREGLSIDENLDETETNFLARLRDRIVNQGMMVIIEDRNPRIEHLEDLVFERGTRGIKEALSIVMQSADNTSKTVTVKWDGSVAIMFGRNTNGDFVLTDKAGFTATGYNGLATTVTQIEKIMKQRDDAAEDKGKSANRVTTLMPTYQKLFPMLRQAVPVNYRGYIKGDLLYAQQPHAESGAWVFKPNFVDYHIPQESPLGKQIATSEVGIAIHTIVDSPGGVEKPINSIRLDPVPGLLLIEPRIKDIKNIKPNKKLISEIKQLVRAKGAAIDQLFNPAELRSAQLTDLPALCKRYINSRIMTNYENLLPDFGKWVKLQITPRKFANLLEYLDSPRSNTDGLAAAFTAFLALHDLKTDLLDQLDRQQPGQEGWVLATDSGRAKLVNRFGFSAGNRALHNPEIV